MKRTESPQPLQTTYEVYMSDNRVHWHRSGGSKSIRQAKAVAIGWTKRGYYTRVVQVKRNTIARNNPAIDTTAKPS